MNLREASPDRVRRMFAAEPVREPGPGFSRVSASSRSGESRGCCEICVHRALMAVFGHFSATYVIAGLPAELKPAGGAELNYIGLTSGLTPHTDDIPYWETDSFTYDCGGSSDSLYWRMVIGTNPLRCNTGGHGLNNVLLYLVGGGSSSYCDLGVPRCDAVSQLYQFVNIEDFRGRCGSTLYLRQPQRQSLLLEDVLPCKLCVHPVNTDVTGLIPPSGGGGGPGEPATACIEDYATNNGRTPDTWPRLMYLTAMTSTVTGIDTGFEIAMLWDGDVWTGTSYTNFDDCGSLQESVTATLSCALGINFTLTIVSPVTGIGGPGYHWFFDTSGSHQETLTPSANIDETFLVEFQCTVTGPVVLGEVEWRIHE